MKWLQQALIKLLPPAIAFHPLPPGVRKDNQAVHAITKTKNPVSKI